MRTKRRVASVGVLAVLLGVSLGSGVAVAAGPIKITKCQTITQPGSYLVDNNLTATGDCLVIAADFVTLDLGGFVLTGNGSGNGVTNNAGSHKGIVVRNGTVTNFQNGLGLFLSVGRVEGVQAISNTEEGIFLGGGVVTGNIVMNNGGNGIIGGNEPPSYIVTGNFVNANGVFGIFGNGVATGNTVTANGLDGIALSGVVAGNYASNNDGDGISADGTITGNTAFNNGADGITVDSSTVTGNTADGNVADGLAAHFCAAAPSNVSGNTAVGNTTNLVFFDGPGCNNSNNVAP